MTHGRLSGSQAATFKVPLRWLFFEAGSLLTPLAANDFARWYMAVRYLHWLSDSHTEPRVKKDFAVAQVDSRYRGLFAEEIAIGTMAVVLAEFFDVDRINNTAELGLVTELRWEEDGYRRGVEGQPGQRDEWNAKGASKRSGGLDETEDSWDAGTNEIGAQLDH